MSEHIRISSPKSMALCQWSFYCLNLFTAKHVSSEEVPQAQCTVCLHILAVGYRSSSRLSGSLQQLLDL